MSTTTAAPIRFHFSLNVSDLPRSTAFLQRVLGVAPAKCRPDYAKFELENPPLVLSLEPHAPDGSGALNHVGFRFPDSAALVEVQRRLELAGISTQREEGVECCYAKQTKFWVHDPDGGLWEFYVLEGDIDHRGAGQTPDAVLARGHEVVPITTSAAPERAVWEHTMGQPLAVPDRFGAESLDEVRLRGTFNVPVEESAARQFLADIHDTLRPGGELQLHILTADEPLDGALQLAGPAAYVRHVPVRSDVLDALQDTGFVDTQLTTFRSGPCFQHEGVDLRETRIRCHRPAVKSVETCEVVYKGPFAEVTDDAGHTWRRGARLRVPVSRWESLAQTTLADFFVRMPEQAVAVACGN
jgi:catechol 2,3-dioxygenase-like lactoylglutathione lyase family enzyme